MIILPAIDIQNGTCVRLRKGDFATAHQVAEDPFSTAAAFVQAGAKWIHMVDLDGAKSGEAKNAVIHQNLMSSPPFLYPYQYQRYIHPVSFCSVPPISYPDSHSSVLLSP